jgi:Na+-transporting NADH:ubiquinone oxidoreductase subunit NqrB
MKVVAFLRRQPALVIGVFTTIAWTVTQAAAGQVTWAVALPLIVAVAIRSIVEPSIPGWLARHGIAVGVVVSAVVIVGQLADGTITIAAVWPAAAGLLLRGYGTGVNTEPIQGA